MMLPIEKHWRVIHTQIPTDCGREGCTGQPTNNYLPVENGWSAIDTGYGPGVMGGRTSGDRFRVIKGAYDPYNPQGSIICQYFQETLTRLTFTGPNMSIEINSLGDSRRRKVATARSIAAKSSSRRTAAPRVSFRIRTSLN
jgi:hypothetical protein